MTSRLRPGQGATAGAVFLTTLAALQFAALRAHAPAWSWIAAALAAAVRRLRR